MPIYFVREGQLMDTPLTVMTARVPAVLKVCFCLSLEMYFDKDTNSWRIIWAKFPYKKKVFRLFMNDVIILGGFLTCNTAMDERRQKMSHIICQLANKYNNSSFSSLEIEYYCAADKLPRTNEKICSQKCRNCLDNAQQIRNVNSLSTLPLKRIISNCVST